MGATEVEFCSLDRDVAKKELNLLQFAAGGAAEPSATSTEIVRCEFGNANLGSKLFDHVPDQLFGHSLAPRFTGATHATEESSCFNARALYPFIQLAMDPIRNGNRSNVTGLTAQVHDCPMPFALLQVMLPDGGPDVGAREPAVAGDFSAAWRKSRMRTSKSGTTATTSVTTPPRTRRRSSTASRTTDRSERKW